MEARPSLWVALPELVLFTYQALLGGLALSRHRPEMAYNLATTSLTDSYSPRARSRDAEPLFKNSRFTGWPDSLDHTCTVAWVFLQKAAKQWEWLWKLFGSEQDTVAAIAAYYLFLNTMDFVSAVKAKTEGVAELRGPQPPLFFLRVEDDIFTRTQGVFFGSAPFIAEMLSENGIAGDALPALWNLWMQSCGKWLGEVYNNAWSRARARNAA